MVFIQSQNLRDRSKITHLVFGQAKQQSWVDSDLLQKMIKHTCCKQNIIRKINPDHDILKHQPTHFFKPLTNRKSYRKYQKKYGSTPTVFEDDLISIINRSNYPIPNFTENRNFLINDLEVLDILNMIVNINDSSPGSTFANAKAAQAAQSPIIPVIAPKVDHSPKWKFT